MALRIDVRTLSNIEGFGNRIKPLALDIQMVPALGEVQQSAQCGTIELV